MDIVSVTIIHINIKPKGKRARMIAMKCLGMNRK